jgi:hypothetical protein
MTEVSKAVELLYTQFLLRDIVAKVIPGGLVSLIILHRLIPNGQQFIDDILKYPVLIAIIFIYGIGFMVGMLIQFIGMSCNMIQIHPWAPKDGLTREHRSLQMAHVFFSKAKGNAAVLRVRERFAILKEMGGNFGMSFLLIAIVLIIDPLINQTSLSLTTIIGSLSLVALSLVLFRQNRHHYREQFYWEKSVIDSTVS